jgi:hypothetical protein
VPNFFLEFEFSLGDCVGFLPLDGRFGLTSYMVDTGVTEVGFFVPLD